MKHPKSSQVYFFCECSWHRTMVRLQVGKTTAYDTFLGRHWCYVVLGGTKILDLDMGVTNCGGSFCELTFITPYGFWITIEDIVFTNIYHAHGLNSALLNCGYIWTWIINKGAKMSYTYHDRAEVRQLRLKNSKEKKKEESKIKRQTS